MPPSPQKSTEAGTYALHFVDDFTAPDLDCAKWIPYYLPQWSSRAAAQPR